MRDDSENNAGCDIEGCPEPWHSVKLRNGIPIRRRCRRHHVDSVEVLLRRSLIREVPDGSR